MDGVTFETRFLIKEQGMREPVRVAVTGAAGAISYTILFKIAAGELLGKDQPMILQLVEIPPAMTALDGVVKELLTRFSLWYLNERQPRRGFRMLISFF